MSNYLQRRGNELHEDIDVVDKVPEKWSKFMKRRMVQPLAESNQNNSHCICERPMTPLLCTNCKRTYFGRISRACVDHPNIVYLQDLKTCGNCCMKTLIEIDDDTLANMNQLKR